MPNAREIIERLEVMDEMLEEINRKVDLLMTDQAALDAAVADIGTHADSIDAAVTALVAKINASPAAADFTAEVATLTTASGNLQTATDAANAALAPPPAPAPAP